MSRKKQIVKKIRQPEPNIQTEPVKLMPNYKRYRYGYPAGTKQANRVKYCLAPPGSPELREIRKYQKSTELFIRKSSFRKLVKNIAAKIFPQIRFQTNAICALHEAAEAYTVSLLNDAGYCAILCRRVTVMRSDIQLAKIIRGKSTHQL